ncbi:hypothetical protein Tco_1526741, partial [Tanacetum coccineum]
MALNLSWPMVSSRITIVDNVSCDGGVSRGVRFCRDGNSKRGCRGGLKEIVNSTWGFGGLFSFELGQ